LRNSPQKSALSATIAVPSNEASVADQRYSDFHPRGTCRMRADPASCVVDERLRVHAL
jgi:choline dehydrogenase-like flavoprotein